MGTVTTDRTGALTEFSLQAFVCTTSTIVEVLNEADGALPPDEIRYYRCEHHPCAPGPIFAEPPLHIHAVGSGSPRFAGRGSSDPVLQFLEMLAIEHDYESWWTWARSTASKRGLEEAFDEVDKLYKAGALTGNLAYASPKIQLIMTALDLRKAGYRRACADTMAETLFYRLG